MTMDPFLRWAGGKRWLWPHLEPLLPTRFFRYVEPFVGSGAVFFALQPQSAILSDSNEWLIETYMAIRDEPECVVRLLQMHQARHSHSYYYFVRDQSLPSSVERAAQFLYLNRTCWNALFRVNLAGKFNVPRGTKDIVLYDDDDFCGWSRTLKAASLVVADFEDTLAIVGTGDLVYVDPPYVTTHNLNGFLKYNEKIFSWNDQIRLRECIGEAVMRGATVLMSNADHESVRALYRPLDPAFHRVERRSVIAAAGEKRRAVTELLISLGRGQP